MTSADQIRKSQRDAWDGLATGWAKWDAIIMDQLAPASAAIIDALDLAPGHRHLDIASGTGEPGLTIATLVPQGRTVLTDLSPQMLAVAQRRADERHLMNVETLVASADDLPFDDASFDSVSVRFGYMFFPDMAEATAEFARVLTPGGRLGATVWVNPDANPWTSIAMAAIGSEVPLAAPDPDGPTMFRCGAPGQVATLYRDAGLLNVAEHDVPVDLVTQTPEEYWAVMSEHVSLAVAALKRVDADARARMRTRAIEAVAPYAAHDTVRVPGMARCISGTKRS